MARLLLATALGGLIGFEREKNNRPAGLRTHILVTVGAALIMLISTTGLPHFPRPADPARLAAQVVSGIGFLGAGTIFKSGSTVKGLTTAAGLWVCGGIGLAIGAGYYLGGIAVAVISITALSLLGNVEQGMVSRARYRIKLNCVWRDGLQEGINRCLGEHKKNLISMQIDRVQSEGNRPHVHLEVEVIVHGPTDFETLSKALLELDGVEQLAWEKSLGEHA